MWRESSTDCHGTENGWDCGLCSRFGRAAHQRPARLLSRYGWGRKPCSLCEEVDLDAPVFKHVVEWHMNRCLFMELVCLTNHCQRRAVCVHLLEWLFCDDCVYIVQCMHPFWMNNNELLNQNGIIHNGWPALTECCKWLSQPSWIWSCEDTEWVMELHAVIGNCLVLRKWQVIGQYLSYSCWT